MTDEQKRSVSQAKKDYWALISPEERSQRASNIAKAKWANMTPQERSAHAQVMRAGHNKNK
jgi:hypothetical protein